MVIDGGWAADHEPALGPRNLDVSKRTTGPSGFDRLLFRHKARDGEGSTKSSFGTHGTRSGSLGALSRIGAGSGTRDDSARS